MEETPAMDSVPIAISAQVSLYPLRHEYLNSVIDAAISLWCQRKLTVVPGAMSTLIAGEEAEVWAALRAAFAHAAQQCETIMVVTVSNACPSPLQEIP